MELSALLTPAAEGGYVAFNPETGTTTQGETIEESLANLREATELYLEEFPKNDKPKVLEDASYGE
ncbi:MAG: type II toxin-antitoxin system HicB family antitoxin [Chlorobium sp.]|nr:MAG: type II toxin-antitoxin system HicB family antitoxin [Chlorobium sp.]